jgi:hypothetical protein
MRSHEYDFRLKDLVGRFAGLLVAVLLFAIFARLGALFHLLPAPWPALDVDRTVLTHQLAASQKPNSAALLFIGDSACLMDVSCGKLEEILRGKPHSLNLGTLLYVGFDGYATMLSRYARINPDKLQTVVVLAHPEMLRRAPAASPYLAFLLDFYSGIDSIDASTPVDQLRGLLGLNILEDRLLSRSPLPLPGEYGRFYGFNLDFYRFMDQHGGSAVDPHQYVPAPGQGNAEFRFTPALETQCQALRAAVPPGAKLILGLTPIPESFAPPDYPTRWQAILDACAEPLKPNLLLTNLPPTMPDRDFASTTHLNARGSSEYTDILANYLKVILGR